MHHCSTNGSFIAIVIELQSYVFGAPVRMQYDLQETSCFYYYLSYYWYSTVPWDFFAGILFIMIIVTNTNIWLHPSK